MTGVEAANKNDEVKEAVRLAAGNSGMSILAPLTQAAEEPYQDHDHKGWRQAHPLSYPLRFIVRVILPTEAVEAGAACLDATPAYGEGNSIAGQ